MSLNSVLLLISILNIFSIQSLETNKDCLLPSESRFDCSPDDPRQETCESRGCCWYPNKESNGSPQCFFPSNYQGYVIQDIENRQDGVKIRLSRNTSSGLPEDLPNINVEVIGLDNERVRVRIVDADASRFEVPMPFLNVSKSTEIDSPLYSIKINRDFGTLQIIRSSTGASIFHVSLGKMIYANQFIQLSSLLTNNFLYGLGEHKDTFKKTINGWKSYTLFAGGTNPTENINLYASYPFYLMIEPDNQVHGVFLLNSNAMDIITQPTPAITWRTIGGILDFFIYLGPTAPQVVRQNLNLIGRPVMQPYWSLGFHLCRYDYGSTNKTRETFYRNIEAGIPIEAQWNDIDYMERYNDFTIDPINFAGLSEFVDELHSMNLHYVLIMDAGVSGSEPVGTYPPFDDGKEADLFIKNHSDEIFLGRVWNFETTAFPDFTHPATLDYWRKQFADLKNQIDYDGVWIDMNEPYNFYQIMECSNNTYDYPPYTPGIQPLYNNTICMSSKQYGGLHYDLHSLFGLHETVATYEAVKNITGIRPFILSRSTFSSQGHYGSHWSGDIRSTWDFMRYSISNMFEFNIYGIPMIGSDICGFAGNTTEELCMRWQTIGAFYPFSRNHNDYDTIEQDPVALGQKVIDATKYAVNLRYRLLPYLYTLFYKAHINGDTVIRPLFFEFPSESDTYSIEDSFMWGSSILVVPILEPNVKTVNAYFPKGLWYDFENLKLSINSTGQYENITLDDDKIGVYVRGGSIIPGYLTTAMSVADLSKLPGYLFVFFDQNNSASGSWFSDDGKSLENIQNGQFTYSVCQATSDTISCNYENIFNVGNFEISGFLLIGLDKQLKNVSVNERQVSPNFYSIENQIIKIDFPSDFDKSNSFIINLKY